jgi:hypothetical protein
VEVLVTCLLNREKLHATWGFVQAGQNVQGSAVCKAVLLFGLNEILFGF